jgi:sugar lactone lactonase YvrE
LTVGQRIGCVALRAEHPGFIAGLEHSIALLTLEPLQIRTLSPVDPHLSQNRCNDGKCDAGGRFWFGTLDMNDASPTGWFFGFDAERGLVRTVGPFICTNGPAFAPDGKTMYCVDSYGRVVYRCDLGPAGCPSTPRVFTRFEPEWGYPDGLTCDSEACVWIAHWGGSRLSRFDPDGRLIECMPLPVAQPTSCTFGGADFKQLFITSAAKGLQAGADADGLAGAVFCVDLEVGGLPACRYRG